MANEPFELEIISPTSNQIIIVAWVEVEGPTGSFFVGPDHSPLVSIIKKNSTFFYQATGEKTPKALIVHEGLFRVNTHNKATVVLTS